MKNVEKTLCVGKKKLFYGEPISCVKFHFLAAHVEGTMLP